MKNLSFRELSALGSALAIAFCAYTYLPTALWLSEEYSEGMANGLVRVDFLYPALGVVVFLAGIQVVYHVILAILMRSDANEPRDERDRVIGMKAARVGYGVMITGIVGLIAYLLTVEIPGLLAAQYLLLVLFVAEAIRYGSQFLLYRMSI